ncbi:sugar ABC transporter ATP-binding protein [Brenneria goodwinii]|nr:sugar ABC transporter ATP-binding protein [Brenneria goodwinii]MCG8174542.1 sugar ABC transporter ATP-binding protein [Brenneria goodwinii]MCG8187471.1 sugar ABC transporter ATP-binding protein [Brenneria goodwinii]MCG8198052.1 sugar ABC transporter ATP-binding protein [Brenneria goodwinii]
MASAVFLPDILETVMLLQALAIQKQYPGVRALDGVDFELKAGEVHVLFGENGAGKSTLIGIIAGLRQPDSGVLILDDEHIGDDLSPGKAKDKGISAVFQEFSLVSSLTVLDNLFLGREIRYAGVLGRSAMRKQAEEKLASIGFDIDLDRTVGELSRAHRQMVEIAKALLVDTRVLILDEPTASLTDNEADRLLDIVRQLRAQGVGIIYVSHRMREIRAIADRITVLRSGRKIGTLNANGVDEGTLIEMMTGRRIDVLFPDIPHSPAEDKLVIRHLATRNGLVVDASITVRAGEVVGIAGLVGCGKSEVGRAVFGLDKIKTGNIALNGKAIAPRSPRQMLKAGVAYFPSDRGAEGLALNRSVRENTLLAALDLPRFSRFGWINRRAEREAATAAMILLDLRPPEIEQKVEDLSGGNKQKVMLGRGLTRQLEVFIFDEPTVGIDVGAKVDVYQFIAGLVGNGAAVVVISSELPEVLALSNRVYVMHEGRVVSELQDDMRTAENVLKGFFGHSDCDVARLEGV